MYELKKAIDLIRDYIDTHHHGSVNDFSKAIGMGQTTVNRIVSGNTADPSYSKVVKILNYIGDDDQEEEDELAKFGMDWVVSELEATRKDRDYLREENKELRQEIKALKKPQAASPTMRAMRNRG